MQKFGQFGGMVGLDGKHVSGVDAINSQADTLLHFTGYHPTVALSWFLTLTELSAGVLLMVGLLTPLAAAAVIGDMFNLIFGLGWQAGWFGKAQGLAGYEFVMFIFVAAIAISLAGPGRYSVDASRRPMRMTGIMRGERAIRSVE